MSLKNVTSPEKNISVLELHIDKAAFDDAVTKAYKKNVGKMNVPGFRKGKAPKSIIEKMYGAAVFYDDALDMLLPDLYASAVEEAKLEVKRPFPQEQELVEKTSRLNVLRIALNMDGKSTGKRERDKEELDGGKPSIKGMLKRLGVESAATASPPQKGKDMEVAI